MFRVFNKNIKLDHTVQITSFGGSGTTMMYKFLEDNHVNVPSDGHDWLPWKHLPAPPDDNRVKDGFRALYIFSNPMNAVMSVFRRGYQHWHVQNMNMTDEYSAWDNRWNLHDYVEQGEDHFRMANQYYNWTHAKRSYPILLLKFDVLWERLPEVAAFLGLPSEKLSYFPKRRERQSDWTTQPLHVRQGLERMYGELGKDIDAAPDLKII